MCCTIVEHEFDELHLLFFGRIIDWIGEGASEALERGLARAAGIAGIKEVGAEYETWDDQDERAADAQVRSAEAAKMETAATTFSAPIFDVWNDLRRVSIACTKWKHAARQRTNAVHWRLCLPGAEDSKSIMGGRKPIA